MKNLKNKEYKKVYLEWLDHCTQDQGWTKFDTVDGNPVLVASVGFLVKETKLTYVLATSTSFGEGGPFSIIIKSCVVNKKWLK